jgi:hypothetical protein
MYWKQIGETMINLPAALQTVLTVGGFSTETDATASVTGLTIDWLSKKVTMNVQQGTTTGQVFAPGQFPSSYQIVVNLVTGGWFINGSALFGTFDGATLASLVAIFLPLRNSMENLTVQVGLFPAATETDWTSI